jgi:mono/diheme cytochrome c family protein
VTAKTMRRAARLVPMLALPLALVACDPGDWITDMKQQPSVGTWQKFSSDSAAGDTIPFRGNPQGSVPTTGIAVAAWQVSYAPSLAAVDSMSSLANPVAADERSLANGRKLYQINCAVCHGDAGDANGTLKQLNPAYGFAPPINGAATQARSDGYIFGMMRNGRGLMPPQNRIPEEMRWDVVNYIRGLQGRHAVVTGPVGFPGQTGDKLPGHSMVGPTVPAAYNKPSTIGITPKGAKAETKAEAGHTGDHE